MVNKRVGTYVVAAATAIAIAPMLTAAPANAADRWAAIVFSPATGAFGWTMQAHSEQQAINLAMGYCTQAGGTDCRVEIARKNVYVPEDSLMIGPVEIADSGDFYIESCVALAWFQGRTATGEGESTAEADGAALGQLGGGKPLVSTCTGLGGDPRGRGGVAALGPAPAPAPAAPAPVQCPPGSQTPTVPAGAQCAPPPQQGW